jgi:sterol desaturase/sphingolipid hydroxylase (fatty acid hydroxylase superfamily)
MAHHFATPDRNYGISNMWIDVLVGSGGRRPKRTEKDESNEGSGVAPQA